MTNRVFLVLLFVSVAILGCAGTPYRDVDVRRLSDEQLSEEFTAAARNVGHQVDKGNFLLATQPDPLYVLSSSTTTYFGTTNVAYSGYAVPTRYGAYFAGTGQGTYSGVGQTRYYYTDVNALARIIHVVGAAAASLSAEAARKRGQDVAVEMQRRVEERRIAAQRPVDQFFKENQGLSESKALVTAVLAFTPATRSAEPSVHLAQAKQIIQSMQRGPDLAGDWYGVFAQITKLPDGRQYAIHNFVKLKVVQNGTKLLGTGELGTGEKVELSGVVNGEEVSGTVTNKSTAFDLTVEVKGRKADRDTLKLDFSGGSSAVNVSVAGNVGLFR